MKNVDKTSKLIFIAPDKYDEFKICAFMNGHTTTSAIIEFIDNYIIQNRSKTKDYYALVSKNNNK
jgi:hypothetical protein